MINPLRLSDESCFVVRFSEEPIYYADEIEIWLIKQHSELCVFKDSFRDSFVPDVTLVLKNLPNSAPVPISVLKECFERLAFDEVAEHVLFEKDQFTLTISKCDRCDELQMTLFQNVSWVYYAIETFFVGYADFFNWCSAIITECTERWDAGNT